jgi:hypothetical protein
MNRANTKNKIWLGNVAIRDSESEYVSTTDSLQPVNNVLNRSEEIRRGSIR